MSSEITNRTKLPKTKVLWVIFWELLKISSLTWGGGFVIVKFIQSKFVDELNWVSEDEVMDIITLAQSIPGAIAINASALVGQLLAGWAGMFIAILSAVIPPMSILLVITSFYDQLIALEFVHKMLLGLRIGVVVIILDVAIGLFFKLKSNINWTQIVIMMIAIVMSIMRCSIFYIISLVIIYSVVVVFVVNHHQKITKNTSV